MLIFSTMESKTKTQEVSTESRVYELGYLITPGVPEDKVVDKVDAIKKAIESNNGVVFAEGLPELKELAYEMVVLISNKHYKYTSGHFGWLKFEMKPEGVVTFDKELKANNDLVRFILIKTVKEDTLFVPPKQKVVTEGDTPAPAESASAPEAKAAPKAPVAPVAKEVVESTNELDKKIDNLVIE